LVEGARRTFNKCVVEGFLGLVGLSFLKREFKEYQKRKGIFFYVSIIVSDTTLFWGNL
jgi:hypothetical protein